MTDKKDVITENDTVYEVLTKYPQLKQVLIKISPKYKNLQNPVMFNTIAKVTPLTKAAKVGGIYINEFLLQLNEAIGKGKEYLEKKKKEIPKLQQEFMKKTFEKAVETGPKTVPVWLEKAKHFEKIDVRELDEPFGVVMNKASEKKSGDGMILIQKFKPAPLIAHLETTGFENYTEKISDSEFHIFFIKK